MYGGENAVFAGHVVSFGRNWTKRRSAQDNFMVVDA
jgi:hypothetical protein